MISYCPLVLTSRGRTPPILRYNLHTSGFTKQQLGCIDTYHRKHFCTISLSNFQQGLIPPLPHCSHIYNDCRTALEIIWSSATTSNYLSTPRTTSRGAARNTLPVQLNKDLAACNRESNKLPRHLTTFRRAALNRAEWQLLTCEIVEAYKIRSYIVQRARRRPRVADPHLQVAA